VPPAFASPAFAEPAASRILVIDDNPRIHRDFELVLLEELENPELDNDELRLYGLTAPPRQPRIIYSLDHATSGLEGIGKVNQSLAENRPDQLSFVDIRMPGLDGVETIYQMWQVDPQIQIVICTAYADYSQEDLATRLGHTDKLLVLKKPFDNLEVTQLARTLAKKWQLARQAALKLEQMELLVSRRTQRVLELQANEVQRLREQDQLKQKFLHQLAQELRTPLALITDSLDQLESGVKMELAHPELLRRKVEQLSSLISQLPEGPSLTGMAIPAASPPDPIREEPATDVKLPLTLLIESNPDLMVYLKQLLGHEYQLVEALDDRDGLEKAHRLVPDIIIADIFPPQVDGVRLCREVKANQLTSHIPVILLNTNQGEDCQLKALEAGADDYIPQAFDLARLRLRAEQLLASRRNLRASFQPQSVLQPRDLAVNQVDAHFLQRTLTAIEQNLSDFEFDVEALARSVAVSRRQLFRKLKAVVDLSPKALIRSVRLKRAGQLLLRSEMTVTEITFAVGFQDVKHFRALFREQFGVLPSEYIKSVMPGQSKP
jgi:CheY-like chemotaxis protein